MTNRVSVPLSNGKLVYWLLGIATTIALSAGAMVVKGQESRLARLEGEQRALPALEADLRNTRERLIRIENKVDEALELLRRQ